MQRERVCEHVRDVGPYFMEQLYKLSASPVVYTVRGDHLMACVECWTGVEKGPTAENIALAQRVDHYCQEAGLLVRPYENLCILSPPLIIGRDDIDRIATTLHQAIEKQNMTLKAERLFDRLYSIMELVSHMKEIIDCRGLTSAIIAVRLKQRLVDQALETPELCVLVENHQHDSLLSQACPELADRIQIVTIDSASLPADMRGAVLQRFISANA